MNYKLDLKIYYFIVNMPAHCAAYGCTNRGKKSNKLIKFFRFPTNEERRKEWEIALERSGFKATNHTRICSVHFVTGNLLKVI